MAGFKDPKFSDRLSAAADAKKAAMEKFRAAVPKPDDPAVIERVAAQQAIIEAREARVAIRQTAREAEAARVAAEQARLAEEAAAKVREQEALEADNAAKAVALKAQQQAARDARYAARKARR